MIKSTLVKKIVQTETVRDYLTKKGMMYTYLNPVSYLTALKKKALFDQMDGIFADGSLLVGAIRLVYGEKVTRRSFDMTSMAPELLAYANEKGLSVCVVATRQEMMEKSVGIFAQRYPNIVWKGCRNGYFATRQEMADEARRIASIPEVLKDGENGYMTTPGDVDALVDRLLTLINDPELRRRFSEASYGLVTREFSLAANIEKLKGIYESMRVAFEVL